MITIESAWKKFNEALDSIANFDQILKLHQSFQQEVL